jgi:hypothetical protein
MFGMTDEEYNDPCCGCGCEEDNECQDCYERLNEEWAKEKRLNLETCGAASFDS